MARLLTEKAGSSELRLRPCPDGVPRRPVSGVTFRAAGELQVDGNGTPDGTLSVKAVDWQKLLDLAVASGLLPEDLRPSTENALNLIASLKGPTDTIDVDLTFRRGGVFIGPIPIGDAPRIIIR